MQARLIAPTLFLLTSIAAHAADPVIAIDAGRIRGQAIDGLAVFKGLPCAAEPTRALRWREPQPVGLYRQGSARALYWAIDRAGPVASQPQFEAFEAV